MISAVMDEAISDAVSTKYVNPRITQDKYRENGCVNPDVSPRSNAWDWSSRGKLVEHKRSILNAITRDKLSAPITQPSSLNTATLT